MKAISPGSQLASSTVRHSSPMGSSLMVAGPCGRDVSISPMSWAEGESADRAKKGTHTAFHHGLKEKGSI